MEAINEIMRNRLNWLDVHNQFNVDKIRSINDVEKLYKYCQENEIEYFDNLYNSEHYTQKETDKYIKAITKLLGYTIF